MDREKKQTIELVRIAGTDINAKSTLLYGLSKIKGVSYVFSNAICKVLGFDKNQTIGSLQEKDIEKLEAFLSAPDKKNLPEWMLNQRKETFTGENLHYNGKDLEFHEMQLRRKLYKTKSYKAARVKARLPLRGQRTKSNFRRSKTLAAMKSKSTGGKK